MRLSFLSGLPRSGSTLLGALLCQRTDLQVSATSGLIDVLGAAATTWENSPQCQSGDVALDGLYPILKGIVDAHYKDIEGTMLDKSRGWPDTKIMATMTRVLGDKPRIIATVRPMQECIASFMRISKFKGNPLDFVSQSPLAQHLIFSHTTLKAGYADRPEGFHFVEYANLGSDPQLECDRVAAFLGLPQFEHTLTNLSNPVPENDAKTWGIPDLHTVRPTIERMRYDAHKMLGTKLWNYYNGNEFWKPTKKRKVKAATRQDTAALDYVI